MNEVDKEIRKLKNENRSLRQDFYCKVQQVKNLQGDLQSIKNERDEACYRYKELKLDYLELFGSVATAATVSQRVCSRHSIRHDTTLRRGPESE